MCTNWGKNCYPIKKKKKIEYSEVVCCFCHSCLHQQNEKSQTFIPYLWVMTVSIISLSGNFWCQFRSINLHFHWSRFLFCSLFFLPFLTSSYLLSMSHHSSFSHSVALKKYIKFTFLCLFENSSLASLYPFFSQLKWESRVAISNHSTVVGGVKLTRDGKKKNDERI